MLPLAQVTATLRGAAMLYRTAHWTVSGRSFYGQHLMLMRLYDETAAMVDTVGERSVGYYGEDSVNPRQQARFVADFVTMVVEGSPSPLQQARTAAHNVRSTATEAYNTLQAQGHLSKGLDDLLMKVANMADEHIYLLEQTLR